MKKIVLAFMLTAFVLILSSCKNLPQKRNMFDIFPTATSTVIITEKNDYKSVETIQPSVIEEPVQNDGKQNVEFQEKNNISNVKETIYDNLQPGDYVKFGAYEQDRNTSNGKEPIEWLVLEQKGNNILLISRFALDCRQYNNRLSSVTWETSSLRSWLNSTFLNEAFSAEEQAAIATTQVNADKNPTYSTDPGNSTADKIFIQSIVETKHYFPTDSDRQVHATDYAISLGAYLGVDGNAWCWLRSPGFDSGKAAGVMTSGGVDDFGDDVYGDVCGSIRPSLWISL